MIRRRDHLHTQVQKHPDNTSPKLFYIKFRNKLTKLIRETKSSYYQEKNFKAGNNNKQCWELFNKASNRTKQKQTISHIKYQNGYSLYINIDANKIK